LANSENGDILPPKGRPHIPENSCDYIHCREKFKYDKFVNNAWRQFLALLLTFYYKQNNKMSRRATNIIARKPYTSIKCVSGTECLFHEHQKTLLKGCVRHRKCVSWTRYVQKRCVGYRMFVSWTPKDLL